MNRYISENLRELVSKRADFRCEYCQIHAKNSYFAFHIEHIISLKHGGKSNPENLAFACPICNVSKGSDIGTFLDDENILVRLFNPRIDKWSEHFEVENTGFLISKTDVAEATTKILNLNHPDSIIERREMILRNIF